MFYKSLSQKLYYLNYGNSKMNFRSHPLSLNLERTGNGDRTELTRKISSHLPRLKFSNCVAAPSSMYNENGTRQSTRDFQQQTEPTVAIAQSSIELIN